MGSLDEFGNPCRRGRGCRYSGGPPRRPVPLSRVSAAFRFRLLRPPMSDPFTVPGRPGPTGLKLSRLVGGRPDLAVWGVFALWPAAALAGAGLDWPPGALAGLLLAVPAVWVGLRFPLTEAGLFAALAAFACATEPTLLRVMRKTAAFYGWELPGPANDRLLGPLAGLVLIGLVFRAVKDRPAGLTLSAPAARPRDAAPDVLEGAVSLLSLRDLEGHRRTEDAEDDDPAAPSAARPFDAGIESIRATARGCLKCEHVSVWLWDGRVLREAGGPSQGNVRRPVPDPHRGLAAWCLRTRRPVAKQSMGLWAPRDRSLAAAYAEDPSPPAGVAPLLSGPGSREGDGYDLQDAQLHGLLIADLPRAADAQFPAVLGVFAKVAATALENARRYDRVRGRARRDDLTGLLRRDPLLEELATMLTPSPEVPTAAVPVAVVMGDLDHFKRLNDTHGHAAGDEAIRRAADAWRELLPPGGRLGRYGGEEFIAALPGLDAAAAAAHAAEVGRAVRTRGVHDEGVCLRMTMSFGVAAAEPVDLLEIPRDGVGPAADRLIRRADSALFAAKEAGRDRVAVVDLDGLLVAQPEPAPVLPLGGPPRGAEPPAAEPVPESHEEEEAEPAAAGPREGTDLHEDLMRVRPVARVGANGRVRAVELARTMG